MGGLLCYRVPMPARPAPPPHPAPEDLLQQVEHADFWRALCPELRISDHPFAGCTPDPVHEGAPAQALAQITEEGYLHSAPVLPTALVDQLAACITRLADHGLPTPFALVYDDLWQLVVRASGIVSAVLGPDYLLLPDFWVWVVGPGYEPSGWPPHRDLEQPGTLLDDGAPRLMTLWLPLTDATPSNSCIYALPTHRDPHLPDQVRALYIPPAASATCAPWRHRADQCWPGTSTCCTGAQKPRAGPPRPG